jgi:hypothetical protein
MRNWFSLIFHICICILLWYMFANIMNLNVENDKLSMVINAMQKRMQETGCGLR